MSDARNTDFDRWQSSYRESIEQAVPFLPTGHDFFVRTKVDELLALARRHLGSTRSLHALDVGCGLGLAHPHLAPELGTLEGVDVARETVERARRAHPQVRYHVHDGGRLPFDDGAMDLTFAMGVVHHVPPRDWATFLAELARVTRPGGIVAMIEPNPLNPISRLGASRCEFDREATFLRAGSLRAIAVAVGLEAIESRYILFLPFEAPARRRLERVLWWLPLGAQYILGGRVSVSESAPTWSRSAG